MRANTQRVYANAQSDVEAGQRNKERVPGGQQTSSGRSATLVLLEHQHPQLGVTAVLSAVVGEGASALSRRWCCRHEVCSSPGMVCASAVTIRSKMPPAVLAPSPHGVKTKLIQLNAEALINATQTTTPTKQSKEIPLRGGVEDSIAFPW